MSGFSHIVLNVQHLERSRRFYLDVLAPLGFVEADSAENEYVRLTNARDAVLVLSQVEDRHAHRSYHRKGVGLEHFAIALPSRDAVDSMERHLATLKIPLLGEGKVEMGYRKGYYCLLFEDPDRIMVELVHHHEHYFSREPP